MGFLIEGKACWTKKDGLIGRHGSDGCGWHGVRRAHGRGGHDRYCRVYGYASWRDSVPFAINDELSASVDVGTGNLMVSTRDVSAPSINGMATFGLMYQSLAADSQAAGGAAGAAMWLKYHGSGRWGEQQLRRDKQSSKEQI